MEKAGYCKHWMKAEWCSLCNPRTSPKKEKYTPKHYSKKTVHGIGAIDQPISQPEGYVLVKTISRDLLNSSSKELTSSTTFVHIDGHPFLWAIKSILESAPNLKTIRVIPSMYKKLSSSHLEACKIRNVNVIKGHHKPEMAWNEGEIRARQYKVQQKFFKELSGEQKTLFDELLLMGFECAEITARYFCLKDEPYISQQDLGVQFGHPEGHSSIVSYKVQATIRYLDPNFKTNKVSARVANYLKERVESMRMRYGAVIEKEKLFTEINKSLLEITENSEAKAPLSLPTWRFDTYLEIIKAQVDGRLEKLRGNSPSRYEALVLRFGILDATYKTLQECGDIMKITRERVRQLEESALSFLQISEENNL